MTWFRVDDGLYSHDKIVRIPRAHRAEAIGTWTLCGTWSADKERDGYVPEHIVDEVGGSLAGAEALITAGLWKRRKGGFAFVNWSEFQPTREELLEKRAAESRRKAEYRARKARESGDPSADVPSGHVRNPSLPSRPVPSRDDDVPPVKSHPHVSSDSERMDLSPAVSSVVENLAEYAGRHIHPLVAHDVIEWIESRRGPRAEPLKNPARYYATVIRQSWAEVQQYIDEKGLAS